MLDMKRIIIFMVSFLVFYVLLNFLVPTLGLDKAYTNTFIKFGNAVYGDYGKLGQVEFVKAPAEDNIFKHPFKEYDDNVVIKILNKQQVKDAIALARQQRATAVNVNHAEFSVNVWQLAWLPLLLLFSLILATPISIPRRLIALGLGLVLMTLFTLFKFWIRFVTEVNRHGWLEVGTLNSTWKYAVTHANTIFMFMGISFTVAVLIWVLTTFRKSDKDLFLKKAAT